jgi:hypothetical protein
MIFFIKRCFLVSLFFLSTSLIAAENDGISDDDLIEKPYNLVWADEAGLEVYQLNGDQARSYFEEIAKLRLSMFLEYPYLYRGTLAYEKEYLEHYFVSKKSVIYLALHHERVVGFSNIIPLEEALLEIQFAFLDQGIDISKHMYLGEAILAPEYRHTKGLVSALSTISEVHAKEHGYEIVTFMSVDRPEDHPYKPEGYHSHDELFKYFGYHQNDQVKIRLSWTQIDTGIETDNTLSVWEKKI